MRVIGGEFRSRVLKSVPGLDTRPTPDRLREALFNVLAPHIQGAVFLDAYAGTGAVGIEALSRGAARAIFMEHNRAAVTVIRENLKSLGLESRAQILSGRAAKLLATPPAAGIVFLDPPYQPESQYAGALSALAANPPALAIVQHDIRLALDAAYGTLNKTRALRQGDNALTFYERK
jgi:16S rRNA (guanine(966)-N(2))-methyltransferase RsmD